VGYALQARVGLDLNSNVWDLGSRVWELESGLGFVGSGMACSLSRGAETLVDYALQAHDVWAWAAACGTGMACSLSRGAGTHGLRSAVTGWVGLGEHRVGLAEQRVVLGKHHVGPYLLALTVLFSKLFAVAARWWLLEEECSRWLSIGSGVWYEQWRSLCLRGWYSVSSVP
jgi:hypothetical protein